MGNGGASLDKLFIIVETVALRWARAGRAVVELGLLAKRRDLFMRLSQTGQQATTPQSNTEFVVRNVRVSRSVESYVWI
jgi:hypothetical protein